MYGGQPFGAAPFGGQPAATGGDGPPPPSPGGASRLMLMGIRSVVFALAMWASA